MSSLTCTIIQSNLHWENRDANLKMFEDKINSIKEKTEVIILPEMFTTGFSMQPGTFAETMDGPAVEWMKRISAQKKVILCGSIMMKEGDKFYNRFIWMLPNGQFGAYNKKHLFAYAGEDKHYTAGSKRLIASAKGWKINTQVCYDLRFPVWARQQKQNGENGLEYDLLIYVANWPQRRNHAWKTLLTARAIENQCFVIGVNRVGNDGKEIYHSGDSMVINPMGEVLYHKADEEDIFTITLEKSEVEDVRVKIPFWADADPFLILE
ncbi:MAG: amidohydrolase [Segetibacter sp.]|jgi:omega-amidase|nr:amidohydrolase [Segetibacter sp.]